MATLSHLVDHKAQGTNYLGMIEAYRILWRLSTTSSAKGHLGWGLGIHACW
jgi:hypothetical protein